MSKRKSYSNEDLTAAISQVKQSKLTITQVSRDWGIPRKTLSDHVHGIYATTKPGPCTMLEEVEEGALVQYIKYLSQQGFPMTRDMVRKYVIALVKKSGRDTLFNLEKGPSDKWFRKFFKRHSDLTERQVEQQERSRSRMANERVMKQYFDLLESEVKRLGLEREPGRIFNCDETGWSGKETTKQKVISVKGSHAYQQTLTSAGHITANLCVSADGRALPAFIIFQRCLPHTAYRDGLPGNWMFAYSETGYMDSDLFYIWFRDLFIPNCGRERPVLLVMDNHDSHTNLNVVKLAMENGITLLGLPPHTTHILQPLDVAINGPLKSKFQSIAMNLGFVNKHQVLNKAKFPVVLSYAVDQCLTPARIKDSFRKSGLYPINRDAIDKTQLVTSHLQAQAIPSTSETPSTSAATPVSASSSKTTCGTCGTFLGGNPLVEEGLIPAGLAELFPPVPCKPQTATSRKLVKEARVLTHEAFYTTLENKFKEDEKRKVELQNRKREREERKEEKIKIEKEKGEKKKLKNGKGKQKQGKLSSKYAKKENANVVAAEIDTEVCQSCGERDTGNATTFWIECDMCKKWFHQQCVGLDGADDMDDTFFICELCTSIN